MLSWHHLPLFPKEYFLWAYKAPVIPVVILITLSVTYSFFPMLDCMLHESREPWDLVTTIVVVQSLSHVQLFATPWTEACQAPLSFTVSQSLLRFMSIESVMPSNHLILCCPLLLPSVFPSIRVFSNDSVLHTRWPKDWSFSFSISLSNEYLGLISFRIDWFDLLAVQGTLKSLLKHQFFGSQPSLWSTFHIHSWLLEKP